MPLSLVPILYLNDPISRVKINMSSNPYDAKLPVRSENKYKNILFLLYKCLRHRVNHHMMQSVINLDHNNRALYCKVLGLSWGP